MKEGFDPGFLAKIAEGGVARSAISGVRSQGSGVNLQNIQHSTLNVEGGRGLRALPANHANYANQDEDNFNHGFHG